MTEQDGLLEVDKGDPDIVAFLLKQTASLVQRCQPLLILAEAGVGQSLVQDRLPYLKARPQLSKSLTHLAAFEQDIGKATDLQQAVAGKQIDQNGISVAAIGDKEIPRLVE